MSKPDLTLISDLTLHALQQISPILSRTCNLIESGMEQYIFETSVGTNLITHAMERAREAGASEEYITMSLNLIISSLRNPQPGTHTASMEVPNE